MSLADASPAEWEEMRARIYRWAFRILRNHEDALDATQNVLVRALATGIDAQRPMAWLRRVTVNHCIDLVRGRRPAGGAVEELAGAAGTAETAASHERRRRIAEALAALTPHQRAVLVAKAVDQETFQQIADSLGMAPSTAKTHYLRALQHMRDRLGPQEGHLP